MRNLPAGCRTRSKKKTVERDPFPSSATVAVAMSGGVDSSVAAALLVEKGHRVFGVTMKLWCYAGTPADERSCCSLAAIEDARAAAAKLGIPHYVVGLEDVFEQSVVRPFCLEYSRGRTPNPCVLCNSKVKFGALLDRALSLGADFLATGHYARLERDADGAAPRMRRGADPGKDQSYALWAVPMDRLAKLIFPLGEMSKADVRRLASDLGLSSAERPESQDVCFVESGDCGDFVADRLSALGIEVHAGNVVDASGKVLGSHRGLVYFTVGQRRGLGISAADRRYVVELRPEANAVVTGEKRDLLSREFTCAGLSWLGGAGKRLPMRALAQVRYTHQAAPALVEELSPRPTQTLRVTFETAQSAITPGQSAVFYDGDVVLGGGLIDTVTRPGRKKEECAQEGSNPQPSDP